ncbi:hypothetical protein QA995_42670 [Streptomyces scabiei]
MALPSSEQRVVEKFRRLRKTAESSLPRSGKDRLANLYAAPRALG